MKLKYSVILFILAFFIGIGLSGLILYYTKTYSISYDTKGGTVYSVVNVRPGSTVVVPDNPYFAGYIFDNWYVNGKVLDRNMKIYEDTVLVAKYIPSNLFNQDE